MSTNDGRTPAEIEFLHEKLARKLGDSSLPTLPQVAVEVLNLVNDPNSGIRDFAELIKTDQALTGRMLRLANSAAYAQRAKVTELRRAIVLLGLERTKAMALGFHLSETMKDCPTASALWTHALMRAWLAFHLVDRFDRESTGQAFVIGLMIDAGMCVMPSLVGDGYFDAITETTTPHDVYASDIERYEFTHVDVVTVMTAKMWHFPELLSRPIAKHHRAVSVCKTSDTISLLSAVAYFVGTLPLNKAGDAEPDPRMLRLGRTLFDLDDDEIREVLKNAAADFESTKQMFGSMVDPSISVRSIVEAANEHLGVEPEEAAEDLDGGSVRFEGETTTLELEGKKNNRVLAFIADEKGERILSITIDPSTQTPEQIREELMLDTYAPEQAEKILRYIQQIAA